MARYLIFADLQPHNTELLGHGRHRVQKRKQAMQLNLLAVPRDGLFTENDRRFHLTTGSSVGRLRIYSLRVVECRLHLLSISHGQHLLSSAQPIKPCGSCFH